MKKLSNKGKTSRYLVPKRRWTITTLCRTKTRKTEDHTPKRCTLYTLLRDFLKTFQKQNISFLTCEKEVFLVRSVRKSVSRSVTPFNGLHYIGTSYNYTPDKGNKLISRNNVSLSRHDERQCLNKSAVLLTRRYQEKKKTSWC